MDRHLLIVANGFRVVGFVLGIPSLLVCLWLTWGLIELAWLKPKPDPSGGQAINIGRDGIIGFVTALATGMGKAFEFAGDAAAFAMRMVDVAAVTLTVVGACLFLTGRGLNLHAAWARITAGVALIPIGVSIYMFGVLVRRFY